MAAFDGILCYNDPDVIAALEAGLPHEAFEDNYVLEDYIGPLPEGLDPETISTPGQTPAGVVEDGDILDLGGRALEVMYTPGHSGCDIMLLDKACHILFAADMYYPGPVIIDTGSEDGLRDYSEIMKTVLARVEELGITCIFGGHNRIEETPEWDSGDGSGCPRCFFIRSKLFDWWDIRNRPPSPTEVSWLVGHSEPSPQSHRRFGTVPPVPPGPQSHRPPEQENPG